jgi:hypothetical protein
VHDALRGCTMPTWGCTMPQGGARCPQGVHDASGGVHDALRGCTMPTWGCMMPTGPMGCMTSTWGALHPQDAFICTPNYLYRKQLHRHDIMLNYRDSDGDLVQITEQRDMALLSTDATPTPPRQHSKANHAPWAIYVTQLNDTSVYSTNPYPS